MLTRLLDNWPYKLAAVVIAIALRFYVGAQLNPRTSVTVPISVVHVPRGYEMSDSTSTVILQITGPSSKLDSLRQSDISAVIDASMAHEGANHNLPITVTLIPEFRGQVQIESKSPVTGSVALEQVGTARKSVRISFGRVAPSGFTYGLPSMSPAMAEVSAPVSVLEAIHELVVDVDASPYNTNSATGVNGSFEIVPRDVDGHRIARATVTPPEAHVEIPLIKVASVKSVPVVPALAGKAAIGASVTGVAVDPPLVSITGSAELLAKTNVILTKPVDVNGAGADLKRQVSLDVPLGLTVTPGNNVTVSVRIANTR